MQWEQVLEKQAQHFATVAQKPGWFQYCKQEIISMEAPQGSPWAGLRSRWGAILTETGFKPAKTERDGWWEIAVPRW